MDASQYFQSKGTYLNATHLVAGELAVTIKNVELERVGRNQDEKLVIYFAELPRGLTLNKTNYECLFDAFGPETDDWLGRHVTLYVCKTEFDGKEVDGVRVRVDAANHLAREQRSKPKPTIKNDLDDEIPL